jgi:hypothetical protein
MSPEDLRALTMAVGALQVIAQQDTGPSRHLAALTLEKLDALKVLPIPVALPTCPRVRR